MRRVDANSAFRSRFEADKGTRLGTVTVQDIRLQYPDQAHEMIPGQDIGRTGLAVDGEAINPKLEARRDLLQRSFGPFAARQAIGDDAHMVAAIGLAIDQVQDVAENSPNRRSHSVKDAQRLVCVGGHFRTSAPRRGQYRRG